MSLNHLYPFAGQHAIQSAVFALAFATELDVDSLRLLRDASTSLKPDFPDIQDQHRTTFSIQIRPGHQAPPSAALDAGGFLLNRPAPGANQAAPARSIAVSRENIIIAINDYTRWEKFKSDVDRYIHTLLAPIKESFGVVSIGLQFTDIFVWRADPLDLNLSEVFSKDTRYLTPNVFQKTADAMLWHSHHGFFSEQSDPLGFQQLDNINIARNIALGTHQIQIQTSHQAKFPQPIYKILDENRPGLSRLEDILHSKNKEILADLLSKEVQEKINLNAPRD